jgi:Glyoxalase/Bleomycin resistance protein/Dioxygenase superfamily
MPDADDVKILFIAGFGPIVRDAAASHKLYADDLGLAFKAESGGYLHTEALPGAKTFALWPLSQAAESCFCKKSWPGDIPVPQAWLEFEADDIERATASLERRGYRLLVRLKTEPWGQRVSRFLSPEGLPVGVTFTPAMRERK